MGTRNVSFSFDENNVEIKNVLKKCTWQNEFLNRFFLFNFFFFYHRNSMFLITLYIGIWFKNDAVVKETVES